MGVGKELAKGVKKTTIAIFPACARIAAVRPLEAAFTLTDIP